ncbi:MAG: S-adenosylmethionine decarboxylase [Betaproteobacteria bacterium]|nr:MAG: S-adenosylmethionine decarboxylase [Betaproteobacteria bacterium]
MKDLAPDITRIRLLVEGFYSGSMDEERVKAYLLGVADELRLRVYGQPTIHSPAGTGSAHNQGFDAFVPLIDSGISLYVWSQQRFFSTLLYTCKSIDIDAACMFTQAFFGAREIEHSTF